MFGGGLIDSITDKATAAAEAAKLAAANQAEKSTMQGMLIPDGLIDWYQAYRASWGYGPPSSPSQFAIFVFLLGALIAGFIGLIFYGLKYQYNVFKKATVGKGKNMSRAEWAVLILTILVLLYLLMAYFIIPLLDGFKNPPNAEGFQATDNSTVASPPPSTDSSVDTQTSSRILLNMQPLAVKQIGYIGPKELKGSFDRENSSGIISALKSGVRFFTFQIDYLTKNTSKGDFDPENMPTLVYRDNSGKLVSKNGLSISMAAQALASYAFNASINSSTEPLILYLHFVKTPNALIDPTAYLEFLSKVAVGLQPLLPHMTNTTSEGSFQRQQYESILLRTPFSTFSRKVIVLTNADTTLFRNPAVKKYDQSADLDYMSNIRVYLDSTNDTLGITEAKSGAPPNAIIVSHDRLRSMNATEAASFAKAGRERFVIVMPKQIENPSKEEITTALTTLGVNIIPLNMFDENIKSKIAVWNSEPLNKLKPMMLLSQKPNVTGAGATT